jgi:hypothetical protein
MKIQVATKTYATALILIFSKCIEGLRKEKFRTKSASKFELRHLQFAGGDQHPT